MDDSKTIIERLDLAPHPEGGWYRETWRGPLSGGRATGTIIYFLLEDGQSSGWHTVDATEIWLWHAGHPITLRTAPSDKGPIAEHCLGPDILGGDQPQHVIAKGDWQAASARQGWALMSCMVSPGFEFSGFKMADDDWEPA